MNLFFHSIINHSGLCYKIYWFEELFFCQLLVILYLALSNIYAEVVIDAFLLHFFQHLISCSLRTKQHTCSNTMACRDKLTNTMTVKIECSVYLVDLVSWNCWGSIGPSSTLAASMSTPHTTSSHRQGYEMGWGIFPRARAPDAATASMALWRWARLTCVGSLVGHKEYLLLCQEVKPGYHWVLPQLFNRT